MASRGRRGGVPARDDEQRREERTEQQGPVPQGVVGDVAPSEEAAETDSERIAASTDAVEGVTIKRRRSSNSSHDKQLQQLQQQQQQQKRNRSKSRSKETGKHSSSSNRKGLH
ncbi:hypothetical protein Taro_007303, partial [Colocasia esculenta]|nr:hypothetical protein [Colocasia esculenta]